jgi:hypothetical protein
MAIQLITQPPKSHSSGQACVAMVAGVSFNYAVLKFGHRRRASSYTIRNVLYELDVECGYAFKRPRRWCRGRNFESDMLCILKLSPKWKKSWCWVVFTPDYMIHDPAGKVYHVTDLPEDIRIVSYLPVGPGGLKN